MRCAFGLGLAALLLSCTPARPATPSPPPPVTDDGGAVRFVAGGLAATRIDSAARFVALAYHDGGLLLPGRTMKFLVDRRDPAAPAVYFMNSNHLEADGQRSDAAKYHFHLAERVLSNFTETIESFRAVTYDTNDKRYVAGSIQTFFVDGAETPLYGIQFFPEDVIAEDMVVEAARIVTSRFTLPGAKLAFVATGRQQGVGKVAAARLAELGVAARTLDDVLGGVDFIPLNRGEAWGYLRMYPRDQDALSPQDIPVFDELPLDLGVVAATITRDYQDPTSHVNLKSKERGTPNMVLRSAGPGHAVLARLVDQPVHLTVGVDGFRLDLATAEDVEARAARRRTEPWVELPFRPSDALPSYAEMCPAGPADCLALTDRFGGKAASLGFLTNAQVLGRVGDGGSLSARYGYDLVPGGLGVPFSFYRSFVDHPPNAQLRGALAELIASAKRDDLPPKVLAQKAAAVRDLFYAADVPPGMVERVAARIATVLPGVAKVKVRSSANAEDMPNFDGAGLYTSFAANLDKEDKADGACQVVADGVKLKVKPKTLACALKGVFASVWNKRAIEERTFARLDHATAMMGIAIVADYDLEEPIAANAVVVTRVINSRNVYGYTLATQQGNVLVTNPEPGTLAETMIAAFTLPGERPSFAATRYATPVAGKPPLTHPVLSDAALHQLVEITRTAEIAYCLAKPGYYPNHCDYAPADPTKVRALDYELKILESGRFICKQMREFSGR